MGQFSRLGPLLRDFVEKGPAGCACVVAQRGEVVFEDYVGYADVDTKVPIGSDTIYRIYSMSKVITCVAALMLYERGLYLLNDPLEEYLPEFANPQVYRTTPDGVLYTSPAKRSIAVKDLFTMTSGMTYDGNQVETERHTHRAIMSLRQSQAQGNRHDVRTVSRTLAAIPLAFDPGDKWWYGLSHDVLGAFIEALSGKTFGEFLHDEIFAPLAMTDTFFRIPDEKRDRLCSMYNRAEDGTMTKNTDLDIDYQPEASFESGGAGILSTLSDYSRFAQMLAGGGTLDGVRILGRKTVELMATNHLSERLLPDFGGNYDLGYGYGLGVRVMIDRVKGGSNSSLGEFGWSGMAGSWVSIDPSQELSVVYMQQMLPSMEPFIQPRLRAVVYGGSL